MAECRLVYAEILTSLGEADQAVRVMEEALKVLTAHFGNGHERVKQMQLRLAFLYERAGLVEMAITACERLLAQLKDTMKGTDASDAGIIQTVTKKILELHLRTQPLPTRTLIEQLYRELPQHEILAEVSHKMELRAVSC